VGHELSGVGLGPPEVSGFVDARMALGAGCAPVGPERLGALAPGQGRIEAELGALDWIGVPLVLVGVEQPRELLSLSLVLVVRNDRGRRGRTDSPG
jgi:hypothetical protein